MLKAGIKGIKGTLNDNCSCECGCNPIDVKTIIVQKPTIEISTIAHTSPWLIGFGKNFAPRPIRIHNTPITYNQIKKVKYFFIVILYSYNK